MPPPDPPSAPVDGPAPARRRRPRTFVRALALGILGVATLAGLGLAWLAAPERLTPWVEAQLAG